MADRRLVSNRFRDRSVSAIIFIHGFSGNAEVTWGLFPKLLQKEPRLRGWDIHSFGYSTSIWADIVGVWKASPRIATLADLFRTKMHLFPLNKYQNIALITHSMGGLIAQKALVDNDEFASKVSHLIMFGTPSNGLKKASFFKRWKLQISDMAAGGPFITKLRKDWEAKYLINTTHLKYWAIAGDEDQFVPEESSIDVFPKSVTKVVEGNHLTIVKPDGPNNSSVRIAVECLAPDGNPITRWDSDRIAAEQIKFNGTINKLWPNRSKLDSYSLVELSLALETLGRSEEAIQVLLENRGSYIDTDVWGTLGGRYKRKWMVTGNSEWAEKSMFAYIKGYDESVLKGDHQQSFYLGINIAFLTRAYKKDKPKTRKLAAQVLVHCGNSSWDKWRLATEGEAYLLLENIPKALNKYRAVLRLSPLPSSRELASMYQQAYFIATRIHGDVDLASAFLKIFKREYA